MFRALRHKNFNLYLGGQLISQTGTWMQQLAMSWLVYRLSGSPFWLGLVTFSAQVPSFIFCTVAGVIVDRVNQLRLLKTTQALLALNAVVLAMLTFSGKITLTWMIALSLTSGMVTAFDLPTRQAFLIQMVGDKRDLPNAIALNSSVMNGTRLFGPGLAGILIGALGEGWCFLLNAASFGAVLLALFAMKVPHQRRQIVHESIRSSLKEGFLFVSRARPIASLLLFLSVLSLIGTPYITLLPAFSDHTLKGGIHTYTLLSVSAGIGTFIAALSLALRKSLHHLERTIGWSGAVMALCLCTLSWVRSVWVAMPLLFLTGLGAMIQMAGSNILIQSWVDDDKRGRVMGLFTLALLGVSPFGNLFVGTLAENWGLPSTFAFCGLLYFFTSMIFLTRRKPFFQAK